MFQNDQIIIGREKCLAPVNNEVLQKISCVAIEMSQKVKIIVFWKYQIYTL